MIVIASIVYGLVGLVVWRLSAGHMAYRMARSGYRTSYCQGCYINKAVLHPSKPPSGYQWFGGYALGFLFGLAWPLTLALAWRPPVVVGAEAEHIKDVQAERIVELEQLLEQSA